MQRAHHRLTVCLAVLLGTASAARAQDVVTLDRVQVTATRTPQASAGSARRRSASSASKVRTRTDTLGASVSEKLSGVPGLLARNRQNFAQDEQLSIRGFGTRASFGIRGLRLLRRRRAGHDARWPGPALAFPAAATQRASKCCAGRSRRSYGNAAGGVMQLFTADGLSAARAAAARRRAAATATAAPARVCAMPTADMDYMLGLNHFATDGYRDHSRAERTLVQCQGEHGVGGDARLTLLANALWAPDAQDPLGLDRAQFEADPRQASAGALQFNTRKSVTQRQLGPALRTTRGRRAVARCWRYARRARRQPVPRHPGRDAGAIRSAAAA